MTDRPEHVEGGIPEGVEPGVGWTCANGHRHFLCYLCRQVRTTEQTVDHLDHPGGVYTGRIEPQQPDDAFSVCDDCLPELEARLRVQGIIT